MSKVPLKEAEANSDKKAKTDKEVAEITSQEVVASTGQEAMANTSQEAVIAVVEVALQMRRRNNIKSVRIAVTVEVVSVVAEAVVPSHQRNLLMSMA